MERVRCCCRVVLGLSRGVNAIFALVIKLGNGLSFRGGILPFKKSISNPLAISAKSRL